jgi:hypothetical protein
MAGILKVDTIQNSSAENIITQTNSTTLTIGTSGDTVTLAAGATSSGFGATYNGAVNWDTTVKTTGFTAVSGNGYFVNTTSGAITVTLPITPSAGAIVAITDYAGTAATNNITIGRNGSKIEAVAADVAIRTNRDSITLVYIDSTQGWLPVNDNTGTLLSPFVSATGGTVLTCGDYKTHVFTGPGNFTVTNEGQPTGSNSVEYLVVAGGGGGGAALGAGGGAGGYRQNYPSPTTTGLPVTATTYPITVGGGGTGGGSPSPGYCQPRGTAGSNSIFSTITSAGGGIGGGGAPQNSPLIPGLPGGSGGGGGIDSCGSGTTYPGGTGNSPPVSPSQGNPGGSGIHIGPQYNAQGGGGGASAAGANGTQPVPAGPGGAGSPIATTFFGPTSPSYGTPGPAPGRYFSGGGGGGGGPGAANGGAGGGGTGFPTPGGAGTTNTGGGGGGSGSPFGGSGGSGIVVIRYKFQ